MIQARAQRDPESASLHTSSCHLRTLRSQHQLTDHHTDYVHERSCDAHLRRTSLPCSGSPSVSDLRDISGQDRTVLMLIATVTMSRYLRQTFCFQQKGVLDTIVQHDDSALSKTVVACSALSLIDEERMPVIRSCLLA